VKLQLIRKQQKVINVTPFHSIGYVGLTCTKASVPVTSDIGSLLKTGIMATFRYGTRRDMTYPLRQTYAKTRNMSLINIQDTKGNKPDYTLLG
jgi:hypothetical protein